MVVKNPKTETWRNFIKGWSKFDTPGRPTKKEVTIYKKFGFVKLKKKGARALVLGSTPEIRDMLARQNNLQVYVIDVNIGNILAMSELMKNKGAKDKEIWMEANWLNNPLPENYFDLIYGDFVICNILFEKQNKFLANIKGWLKKDGLFITRCTKVTQKYKELSLKNFCQLFENKPVNLKTINHFWELGVFLGESAKGNRFSPGTFYKRLKRHLKKYPNKNIDKILNKGGFFYPLEWSWSLCKKKRIENLLSKHFITKKSEFDDKMNFIYPDFYPICCFKPKE